MNLIKSTAVVSFFTLLSRMAGFVRDALFARFFGASVWTDAFVVAFKIPNFMRRIFAEGSFSLAFIPVLNEIKAKNNELYLKQFINHVLGCLLAVLLIVLAVLELLAPGLIMVFGPGFMDKPEVFTEAVNMVRITLPYLLFISLVAFSSGILNSFGKFAAAAATPILLNAVMILSMIYFRHEFHVPIMSLAWGVLVAGAVQLAFQIPFLVRLGVIPKPVVRFHDPEVKKVMTLMLPTLLGSSVAQINLLIDTMIATLLPLVGSPTYLYYSDRLLEFPLGLFGIAISTVILPKLAQTFAERKQQEYQQTLRWAMSLAMFVALPSALGMLMLAKPIVITLFAYDQFTLQSASYTSYSLMVFMLGLPAFVANKVLLPAFYSRKDTKSPVKIALKAMLVNAILNFAFVGILYYYQVVSLHMGLAMAGVSSAWMQCYWLYRKLKQDQVIQEPLLNFVYVLKLIASLFVMGMVLFLALSYGIEWYQLKWYDRCINLFVIIMLAASSYLISMWLLKAKKDF
ncbi:murein biosynthesis integral membrane protein MurJ [Marinicella litoralis]|uniref:Probable lipid II flippase MurJ n=1 Tax=Marinicella litoralis TaxID=644220 RepID=A0A4R6XKD0_9GAMM|nr:murein biosynthesis integral membrane protein MurJ [Marinicella litoralis]TDR18430.1 putative peptidoglycan lipid II flippase [Marinicella litoralis]